MRRFGIIIVILVAVVLAVVLVAMSAARQKQSHQQEIRLWTTLKVIGVGCQMYADEHAGKFPSDWLSFLLYTNRLGIISEPSFVPPQQWAAQFQLVGGLNTSSPPDSVLAVSLIEYPSKGRYVLFVDGHAGWVPDAQPGSSKH